MISEREQILILWPAQREAQRALRGSGREYAGEVMPFGVVALPLIKEIALCACL
jgi:hypothetical protein